MGPTLTAIAATELRQTVDVSEEALAEFNPAFSGPVYELPLTASQTLL